MKKYNLYIPISTIAATIVLGGSLSAQKAVSEDSSMRNQQGQRHQSSAFNANLSPLTASEVQGMNIDNANNEKIGEIDEILIDPNSGEVVAMVVSTGGLLGVGQEQSLISPKDLRYNSERTLFQADLSKAQIGTAPAYKEGEMVSADQVRPISKTNANKDMQTTRQSNGSGLAISDLVGMNVENRQGETIGDVEEVFINIDNKEVVGVVISTGGFLGMGDRKTLFGIKELTFDSTNDKVLMDYNRDEIRGFSEYKENDQSVFDELYLRVGNYSSNNRGYNPGIDTRTNEDILTRSTNERSSNMTVFSQGNSSEEIAMTASIRSAIRDNDNLSFSANNVTIITSKGKVVLRGEVDSTSEKTTIEGIAWNKAGRQNVTSELTVDSKNVTTTLK